MCVYAQSLSRVQFFGTLWTVSCQAHLSMGFSRQEYWGGLPFPTPRDLPDPGTEAESLVSPALAGDFFTWEALHLHISRKKTEESKNNCLWEGSYQRFITSFILMFALSKR